MDSIHLSAPDSRDNVSQLHYPDYLLQSHLLLNQLPKCLKNADAYITAHTY